MAEPGAFDYRSAGVDLDAAERTKKGLKSLVASTSDEHTLSALGQFGGLYAVPGEVESPVLVSSTDGVGTKLKVAFSAGRHDTVGQDLVNHCVDDILVQGARPLFFLDYLACGTMDESVVAEVVGGVAAACKENGCALLGGETAQMPEFYARDEYDLAGFIVGGRGARQDPGWLPCPCRGRLDRHWIDRPPYQRIHIGTENRLRVDGVGDR